MGAHALGAAAYAANATGFGIRTGQRPSKRRSAGSSSTCRQGFAPRCEPFHLSVRTPQVVSDQTAGPNHLFAPVRRRHRAVGGPFCPLKSSRPPTDTPDGLPESKRTARNSKGLCQFPPRRPITPAPDFAPSAAVTSISASRAGENPPASGFLMESGCTYAPTVPVSTSPARS
jgi:hypothetical protein